MNISEDQAASAFRMNCHENLKSHTDM